MASLLWIETVMEMQRGETCSEGEVNFWGMYVDGIEERDRTGWCRWNEDGNENRRESLVLYRKLEIDGVLKFFECELYRTYRM